MRPKPKYIWKPKSSSHNFTGGPSSSGQTGLSPLSETIPETTLVPILNIVEPCVEIEALLARAAIATTFECIDRVWGSSSDWVLELQDRRRVSISLSLHRPMPPPMEEKEGEAMEILKVTINEGQGLKQTDPSTQRCLKLWSEGDEEDDEVSVVWEC